MNRFKTYTFNAVTKTISALIGIFNPDKAMTYRSTRDYYLSYIAATQQGANKNWRPKLKSGDAELRKDLKFIIARARDLSRNNSVVSGAIAKICRNVIRNGLKIKSQIRNKNELNETLNKEIDDIFKTWSKLKICDYYGFDTFYTMQKNVLRLMYIDGDCFIRKIYDSSFIKLGLPPLRMQIIESDMIDLTVDGRLKNGNKAKRGIEFNNKDCVTAYYFYSIHPSEGFPKTVRVPANDIIHIYIKNRPSLSRGVSSLSSIIMDMYDLNEYRRYEMIGAKVAASFGVFVKSNIPEVIRGQNNSNNKKLPTYIDAGRIHMLPHGTEIQIASHNRPPSSYKPFVNNSLKFASTGVGMSYSSFSNDYTDSSYSSERSATLEERLTYSELQDIIDEKLNAPVWKWFIECLFLSNIINLPDFFNKKHIYSISYNCLKPGWNWVDPLKDSKAAEIELQNKTNTRREILSAKGIDYDEFLEIIKREQQDFEILEKSNEL